MKNVFLTGFMGVGKTTIGKKLADELNYTLLDTDDLIETELKLNIPAIFEEFGEAYFRTKEYEVIQKITLDSAQVIALGGGAYLNPATRKLCSEHGITVHLFMSFEMWKKRIPQLIKTRPLLQEKSLNEIEALFNSRMSVYNQADISLDISHLTQSEIVQAIKQKIKH